MAAATARLDSFHHPPRTPAPTANRSSTTGSADHHPPLKPANSASRVSKTDSRMRVTCPASQLEGYVRHHHRTPPRRNVTSPSCDAAILPRARGPVYAPASACVLTEDRARNIETPVCQDENRHDVRPRRHHHTASAYDARWQRAWPSHRGRAVAKAPPRVNRCLYLSRTDPDVGHHHRHQLSKTPSPQYQYRLTAHARDTAHFTAR